MKLETYEVIAWFHDNKDWKFIGEVNHCFRFKNISWGLEADFMPSPCEISWYTSSNKFCGITYIKEVKFELAQRSCPNVEVMEYIQAISKEITNET